MRRGVRAEALPQGIRQDSRRHTRHPLRPERDAVDAFLAGELSFEAFAGRYRVALEARVAQDPGPFDALAALARAHDVWIGCSCPTKQQPHVEHCHTWLALQWMAERYPDVEVRFPDPTEG